jgi:hypothetical protein
MISINTKTELENKIRRTAKELNISITDFIVRAVEAEFESYDGVRNIYDPKYSADRAKHHIDQLWLISNILSDNLEEERTKSKTDLSKLGPCQKTLVLERRRIIESGRRFGGYIMTKDFMSALMHESGETAFDENYPALTAFTVDYPGKFVVGLTESPWKSIFEIDSGDEERPAYIHKLFLDEIRNRDTTREDYDETIEEE